MSNEKKDKSLMSKFVPWLILYTFGLIAVLVANFATFEFSDDIGNWGSVGDYFGGLLNPILAFLSFIALLYTLKLNQDALKLNQEELAETRKELARAAKAQEESQSVMAEQLKIQLLQQFESHYYQLVRYLNKMQDRFLEDKNLDLNTFFSKNYSVFEAKQLIVDNPDFDDYLKFMNKIFVMLDKQINDIYLDNKGEELKKTYIDLISHQQNSKTLNLIFIYCHRDQDDFRSFLEKYSFLNSINFYHQEGRIEYSLLQALLYYKKDDQKFIGFRQESKLYRFLDKNLLWDHFVQQNNYSDNGLIFARKMIENCFIGKENRTIDSGLDKLTISSGRKKYRIYVTDTYIRSLS